MKRTGTQLRRALTIAAPITAFAGAGNFRSPRVAKKEDEEGNEREENSAMFIAFIQHHSQRIDQRQGAF